MLRATELIRALELEQAVGQRRHGHFDHDAHNMAEKNASVPNNAAPAGKSEHPKGGAAHTLSAKPLKKTIDSKTGRVTHQVKRR